MKIYFITDTDNARMELSEVIDTLSSMDVNEKITFKKVVD